MNKEECTKIMSMIKAYYPAYHSKTDKETHLAAIGIMEIILEDMNYEIVTMALLKYFSELHDYPPNAGQIRDICKKIQSPYNIIETENMGAVCEEELPILRKYVMDKYNANVQSLADVENKYFDQLKQEIAKDEEMPEEKVDRLLANYKVERD